MSVLRVLKKENFNPYKQQVVQELLPQDFQLRIAFAQQQLTLKDQDPSHFDNFLFSDEAHFHLHGTLFFI